MLTVRDIMNTYAVIDIVNIKIYMEDEEREEHLIARSLEKNRYHWYMGILDPKFPDDILNKEIESFFGVVDKEHKDESNFADTLVIYVHRYYELEKYFDKPYYQNEY